MGRIVKLSWITCPHCNGRGEPQGDGSGWDGTSMHTPACDLCDGMCAVPGCDNVRDSCHGDPDVDECVCLTRLLRERGFARVTCPGCLGLPALGGDALSCRTCSDRGHVIERIES